MGADATTSQPALPYGWEIITDADGTNQYYHNIETGATQWDCPSDAAALVDAPAPAIKKVSLKKLQSRKLTLPTLESDSSAYELPSGWEIVVTADGSDHYYHNVNSGATQWEHPVETD